MTRLLEMNEKMNYNKNGVPEIKATKNSLRNKRESTQAMEKIRMSLSKSALDQCLLIQTQNTDVKKSAQ